MVIVVKKNNQSRNKKKTPLLTVVLCLVVVGAVFVSFNVSAKVEEDRWVVEEIDSGVQIDSQGLVIPKDFEQRFLGWSSLWRAGMGLFETSSYLPRIKGDYKEGSLLLQHGFSWGALGLRLAYADMKANNSDLEKTDPIFVEKLYRFSFVYQAQQMFFSEYIVPYIEIGGCAFEYKKGAGGGIQTREASGISVCGAVGFALPFSWVDKRTAITAFKSLGLNETLIYLEARKVFESQDEYNFQTDVGYAWGMGFSF